MAAADIDPLAIARDMFFEQPDGFPIEDFDIRDVQLPPGDDMGIKSDDDDVDEEEIETESGFGSVIVVGNLPVVGPEKFERLNNVVKKICALGVYEEGPEGKVWTPLVDAQRMSVHMPIDSSEQTRGFAFVEYGSQKDAQFAKEQLNGHRLDKNHVLVVNMFDDFDKYMKVPDEYQTPEVKEFPEQENLYEWLMDRSGRDQFCIRHGDETAIYWNDGKRYRADEVYKRTFWTESYVIWSPMGNMLATLHRQGVAVWGGASFNRLQRYSHPNARVIEFSPRERFMITHSTQEPSNPRESLQAFFNIWDTRNGRKLRTFQGPADEYLVGVSAGPGGLKWPVFKWAGGAEDLYFGKLGRNVISVYSTADMALLDMKSIRMEGVHDFEWSPAEPLLAAYTTEQGNLPAKISLVKIPEKTEVRQKNLFSVSDVKIIWHAQGDYLAVKVDRFTKTKKSTYTGFELFSIRERDIPMEVLELPNKSEKVHTFAWEPKGHRFAVVHGDGPRPSVSFYDMRDEKGRLGVRHLGTLTNKACNAIFWSPTGHNIILAGFKQLNGQLEFFNVDEMETLNTAEHFMATDVEWDPTGRYVASSVTSVQPMENGFIIWSFNGKQLYSMPRDRFFQFMWRPRMPSLLPPEKDAEIVKNLKQYSKKYEEEDEALVMQADADVLQERKRMTDEFNNWYGTKAEAIQALQEFRKKMLGDRFEEPEYTMETVTIEQTIDVREEPYVQQ